MFARLAPLVAFGATLASAACTLDTGLSNVTQVSRDGVGTGIPRSRSDNMRSGGDGKSEVACTASTGHPPPLLWPEFQGNSGIR